MTTYCKQRWRAKCNHVRTGGLLSPPPPESNSIVFTSSFTTINNHLTEFDDSPEADWIRKCDEADRTGKIAECFRIPRAWVRTY